MLSLVIHGGIEAFLDYLSAHVLTCLVPAFFIAGAIAVFVSQASVIKYFGAHAKKALSYGVASVSGTVLAVCSLGRSPTKRPSNLLKHSAVSGVRIVPDSIGNACDFIARSSHKEIESWGIPCLTKC
jgi:hypothetical protein